MRPQLSTEALNFQEVAKRTIERAGGFELVVNAERDPLTRYECGDLLETIGTWDLRPRQDNTELEASAVACRMAGWFALPYPVAERLSGEPERGIDALAPIGFQRQLNMADIPLRWAAGDLTRQQAKIVASSSPEGSKLAPFVCSVELGDWSNASGIELSLILQCWVLLGMTESAADMTYQYVQERRQFGKSLASFQALQFYLTDVKVAVKGLEELAKFTLWSYRIGPEESMNDALALRVAALETAERVFRLCHQLHGAVGFCDESQLSWLSRHSQPLRRLPFGRSKTEGLLLERVEKIPLHGPFTSNLI